MLHIISRTDWEVARTAGELLDPSLEAEGFIHCSYPQQVLTPANERYAGQQDLILLVIDGSKLSSKLVVEDSYGSGTAYPHVYGPINLDAVDQTVAFPCDEAGRFRLPEGI